jgi:hypothetical protein
MSRTEGKNFKTGKVIIIIIIIVIIIIIITIATAAAAATTTTTTTTTTSLITMMCKQFLPTIFRSSCYLLVSVAPGWRDEFNWVLGYKFTCDDRVLKYKISFRIRSVYLR